MGEEVELRAAVAVGVCTWLKWWQRCMGVARVTGTEGTEPPLGAFNKHMAATASRPFQGHFSPPVRYGRAEAAEAEWAHQEHVFFLSKVAAAWSRYIHSLAKH